MGKRFKAEEIVMKLREIELALGKGMDAPQACRQAGVSEQSYYRWRKEYGGMRTSQVRKLKDLEKNVNENRFKPSGYILNLEKNNKKFYS